MPAGLLLHFDGNFTDTYRGRDLSVNPFDLLNPPVLTDGPKFGSNALDISSRNTVTTEFLSDFLFGFDDFTITYQFRSDGSSNQAGVVGLQNSGGYIWQATNNFGENPPRPRLVINGTVFNPASYTYPELVYVHVAWVRLAGVITLYADGVQIEQWIYANNITDASPTQFGITGFYDGFSKLDELFVINEAIYSGPFSPPIAPYPDPAAPPPPDPIDRTLPTPAGQFGSGSWINMGSFDTAIPKSEAESDMRNFEPPDLSEETTLDATKNTETGQSIWPLVILVVLAVVSAKE